MSYELNHRSELGILEVRHYGPVTALDAYQVREKMQPFILQQGVRHILVDLRKAKVIASTMEIFSFHASHEQTFPHDIRLAMVCSADNWEPVDYRFAETVTVNRGMSMKSFADPESAIAWLVAPGLSFPNDQPPTDFRLGT